MGKKKERYKKKERKEYGKNIRNTLKNFLITKGGTIWAMKHQYFHNTKVILKQKGKAAVLMGMGEIKTVV